MSEHIKVNAIAENVFLRMVARVSMALMVPISGFAFKIVTDKIGDVSSAQTVIAKAQEEQGKFQATQLVEVTALKERVSSLERSTKESGNDNTQILQRLTSVETLMKTMVDQTDANRKAFDELMRQLIKEQRSDPQH